MTALPEREDDRPVIRPLEPGDVEQLRLGWWSMLDTRQVSEVIQSAPGLSLWVPKTNEYVLVGPWRHRSEIVHLRELVSIQSPIDLTVEAVTRARADGRRMFLAVEMTERRQQSFYDRAGMSLLEDVLSYELTSTHVHLEPEITQNLVRVGELNLDSMASLIAIDWAAFPWLWRNSETEFRDYARQTGVELHLLRQGDQNVGYIGITCFQDGDTLTELLFSRRCRGGDTVAFWSGRRLVDSHVWALPGSD